MEKRNITTKEKAIEYAKEWQCWASERDLSYGELADWYQIFEELSQRFDLVEEFTENGIINECQHPEYYVAESVRYVATLGTDNELILDQATKDTEIDSVFCSECNKEFGWADFERIEY